MPISLPSISWNGDSDPSSTSAIRCIFSSTTPCISGVALISVIMNIKSIRIIGTNSDAGTC